MDRSFDLVALLKQQPISKSHKIKPMHFASVAGGVQKRLETNIKNRKTSRLSVFDRIRNISNCESPARPVLSDVQQKAVHRKQQLEKWKEEKAKKKKEVAAQKKKPFIAAVAHKTIFGPPPPPKPMPGTSGRVTRSQALKQQNDQTSNQPPSFAPSNASFKPPQFQYAKVPTLAPVPKKKTNKSKPNFTFEPVLPKTVQKVESIKAIRSKTVSSKPNFVTETIVTCQQNDKIKSRGKKQPTYIFSSSSGSDMEQPGKKTLSQQSKPSNFHGSYYGQQSKKTFQCSSSSNIDQHKAPSRVPQSKPIFSSSSSSDMEQPMKKTSSKQSKPSNIHRSNYGQQSKKEFQLPAKTCKFQSSSSSDIEQHKAQSPIQSKLILSSSLSSDTEHIAETMQQKSTTLQETTSMSQGSTEQETSEESNNTPKSKILKSESSSEEKLRSPQTMSLSLTPEQIIEEAKYMSPRVTMSRGKENARKEIKKKLHEGLMDEDISKQHSVNHFRRQLDSEIARITTMCDAWDKIFAQTELPEPIQELVLTAVGQARLLMSQKMQQFAGLVERCARPEPGAALVTPADLHGFWDMVFMQVENVDLRFKKLEMLRACDWTEEPTVEQPKKAVAKPAAARKPKPTGGPSRLKEMIAAARKAKKEQESHSTEQSESSNGSSPTECKTFEAGFFSVSSPVRRAGTSAPGTPPNKSSLLRSVLSSEAKKASATKNSSSFAMLRASVMSKSVDIEGVSPLLQTPTLAAVDLTLTPARSILKPAGGASAPRGDKLKTVLFHGACPPASPAPSAPPTSPASLSAQRLGDEKENQPAPRRRSRVIRQDAVRDTSPIMTRSRRKSALTPLLASDTNAEAGGRRRGRTNNQRDTPATAKRSSRLRRSDAAV